MNSSDLGEAMRLDAAARAHEKPLSDLQEWALREQAYTLSLGKGLNGTLERIITLTEIVEGQGARIKALEATLAGENARIKALEDELEEAENTIIGMGEAEDMRED